jgi:phosphinothricin acetyltransferase
MGVLEFINMNNIKFVPIKDSDFPTIKEIYDYYILNSTATFHTEPVSIKELKEYIFVDHPLYKSFLVYYKIDIAGYCYFSYFKKRQAYKRTAEVTLYLKPEFCHKGLGIEILNYIENTAKQTTIKNLIAVITGTNSDSIKLFEKAGYAKCAHYIKVGEKFGKILDVVAYQKII